MLREGESAGECAGPCEEHVSAWHPRVPRYFWSANTPAAEGQSTQVRMICPSCWWGFTANERNQLATLGWHRDGSPSHDRATFGRWVLTHPSAWVPDHRLASNPELHVMRLLNPETGQRVEMVLGSHEYRITPVPADPRQEAEFGEWMRFEE